jgi:4-alpha-glucanotransferase
MLQQMWRQEQDINALNLAKKILKCREDSRPNFVFLHSIPLAPSFVLDAVGEDVSQGFEADLSLLFQKFWTPVGLRTLSSQDPQYRSQYIGHPTERDAAYHQGPVWAWLGGQFQAARDRLSRIRKSKPTSVTGAAPEVLRAKMLPPTILRQMPIPGHIAELFDGMPPFVPRGAPAQAWSSACWREAWMRREWKVDDKMAEIFKRGMIR